MENSVRKVIEYLKNKGVKAELLRFKRKVVSATMASEISNFPPVRSLKPL